MDKSRANVFIWALTTEYAHVPASLANFTVGLSRDILIVA